MCVRERERERERESVTGGILVDGAKAVCLLVHVVDAGFR